MTTIVEWHRVAGAHLARDLKNAQEELGSVDGDVLLDFSDVARIDPSGLHAVEGFLDAADQKAVRVALRGVNVAVYKVLKLARLASRCSFVN
jgi:anti-anti-sigma regulatory factor